MFGYNIDVDPSTLKLARSPLQEMVFDIDCDFETPLAIDELESRISGSLLNQYPGKEYRWHHQIELGLGGIAPDTVPEKVGLILRNDELGRIVQVRTDGFSFNVLAPYPGLDEILPHIEHAWAQFVALASPLLVKHVRIRSINSISSKLYAPPDVIRFLIPESLAQGFVSRDVFTQYASERVADGLATLTTVVGNSANEELILDIVVTMNCNLAPQWADIRTILEELRYIKNEVFINTVEEKWLQSVI